MYIHLKRKFNLDESKINELISECDDHKELFDDYESCCLQNEKRDSEIIYHSQYKVLIEELEEEIKRVLNYQ